MSSHIIQAESQGTEPGIELPGGGGVVVEKAPPCVGNQPHGVLADGVVEAQFNITETDYAEAKAVAGQMNLQEVKSLMENVLKIHECDPNFPHKILDKIKEFLGDESVFQDPERHEGLIYEMKVEAALITTNSPYAEVRSVVDNRDDPATPCSTIRAWVIGLIFSVLLAFINQLFSIRQPSIGVGQNVAQLLAYPLGKAAEKTLPDWGFTLFGMRHSLNPGHFSKKEHMLITIMASVAATPPYTTSIIWTQYLPQYFNQPYAGQFAYQILISLSTNFVGYGMAGLTRRFLVYPSYCVWPASLVTIALNAAFHTEDNVPVEGPFKKIFTMSRLRFFMLTFTAMFVYFWFPNYIFQSLSIFSWLSWIAPWNMNLNVMTGMQNGLGLNPWPTFDWNILLFDGTDPLMIPFFSTFNKFLGMFISMFVVLGIWYSNTYFTGYLPINTNRVWDNTARLYNVSLVTDSKGLFDATKYEAYSPAYLGAANLTIYIFFFAIYPATLMYVLLNHWYEMRMGFVNLVKGFRRNGGDTQGTGQYQDVHNRLMARYQEVPEWWYLICLACALAVGMAGIAAWPTYTTPAVVIFGIILCFIFVIPVGIVKAITGVEVTLNVLAEFIGGSFVGGNALAMNYFKSFGYVTCAHALWFANDLKLAHYIKIPPRQTFWAQMVATAVSTFVCIGVLEFQMTQIPGVCTDNAPNRFTCPGINTFFTAAVLWGTIGPKKVFGVGGQYSAMLLGWPLGLVIPLLLWLVQRWARRSAQNKDGGNLVTRWMRQIHPIPILYGMIYWAPYNLSYVIPAVPIAWLSWIWAKNRFLAFWSKYNYVLSASFSTGIAISAIIIFFSLQWLDVNVNWWGNDIVYQGCEGSTDTGSVPCLLQTLAPGEHFGPGPNEFS